MYACEIQNEYVREEDECVVIKTIINDSEVKMKLLDFMNFQFMQFDLWILSDVLKIGWVITQIKAVLMNDKGDDNEKKTIHISCLHNSLILKVLWRYLRFNYVELNIRES